MKKKNAVYAALICAATIGFAASATIGVQTIAAAGPTGSDSSTETTESTESTTTSSDTSTDTSSTTSSDTSTETSTTTSSTTSAPQTGDEDPTSSTTSSSSHSSSSNTPSTTPSTGTTTSTTTSSETSSTTSETSAPTSAESTSTAENVEKVEVTETVELGEIGAEGQELTVEELFTGEAADAEWDDGEEITFTSTDGSFALIFSVEKGAVAGNPDAVEFVKGVDSYRAVDDSAFSATQTITSEDAAHIAKSDAKKITLQTKDGETAKVAATVKATVEKQQESPNTGIALAIAPAALATAFTAAAVVIGKKKK